MQRKFFLITALLVANSGFVQCVTNQNGIAVEEQYDGVQDTLEDFDDATNYISAEQLKNPSPDIYRSPKRTRTQKILDKAESYLLQVVLAACSAWDRAVVLSAAAKVKVSNVFGRKVSQSNG